MWWLLLLLSLVAGSAWGATITASSCSAVDVQTAITAASNGDTVSVPACAATTWTTSVTIPNSKGITLQGAGAVNTRITDGVVGAPALIINMASGNSLTRVTGFTFDQAGTKTSSGGYYGATIGITGSGLNSFRFDANSLINVNVRGIAYVSGSGAAISGVVDTNVFTAPYPAGVQMFFLQSATQVSTGLANDPANGAFARPWTPGGAEGFFIEDNTFTYGYVNDDVLTGRGGTRFIFRYNTITGTSFAIHGADSGGYRGFIGFEVYRNTFQTPRTAYWFRYRSGTGVTWGNTATSAGTIGANTFAIYRACLTQNAIWASTGGGTGLCDGSNTWDQNTVGANGWRCLDQSGSLFGVAMGSGATAMPNYNWLNTGNATERPFAAYDHDPGVCTRDTDHLQANRDYYNYTASFDGTSGVGSGTKASMPATCTAGVAYWVTDEGYWNSKQAGADGVLYKCTATNTWTLHYVPYPYPHPLRSGLSPPTSPAGN